MKALDTVGVKPKLQYPCVSVLVPMYNEEHHIARCLDSILANDYPKDRLEILVIDGRSTDHSREIVREYTERYPFVRILENPKRIQAAALNMGIREARGEIVVRMDAHTTYDQDYIQQCVTLLQTTGAANVGGAQHAVGTHYVGNAIAIVTTSLFGVGDAKFRYSNREEWVDSVYLGAWYKQTLEDLDGFNEEWVANQDYELNYRLRRMGDGILNEQWEVNEDYELNYRLREGGGKILLSPKIRCQYYVRGSLISLASQYFRYGFWRVKTLVTYPDSLRWRQLAPPALVVALSLSLGILPISRMLGFAVPLLYLVVNLIVSIWTASRRGWKYLPLLPIAFATIHLSWGIGFLAGLFGWGIPRITLSSLVKAFQPPDAA